jgi:serine/threonine protein kinase
VLGPGEIFDRFRIEATIAEGGMGRVYRAFDTRLHRMVALKLPFVPDTLNPAARDEAIALLLREARAAAALDHPNVVVVHEAGEVDGQPYLVLELVAGRALRERVGDPTVPWRERVRWLADVARALAFAHRAGIVHRDIKPENVMIRDEGTVKVLDFGIARFASSDLGSAPTLGSGEASLGTLAKGGSIVGTPHYMAPEQLRGEPVDGRTDQFSWGVMAYELLSGARPWRGDSAVAVLSTMLSTAPELLAAKCPELPAPLTELVMRTLHKEPAQRFESMDELLTALDAAAASTSRPPPPAEVALARTEAVARSSALDSALPKPGPVTTPQPTATAFARTDKGAARSAATEDRAAHVPLASARSSRRRRWLAGGAVAGLGISVWLVVWTPPPLRRIGRPASLAAVAAGTKGRASSTSRASGIAAAEPSGSATATARSLRARLMTGVPPNASFAVDPEGRSIAYTNAGALYVATLDGSGERKLAATTAEVVAWLSEDRLVLCDEQGLIVRNAAGVERRILKRPTKDKCTDTETFVRASPDERHIAMSDGHTIQVVDLDTGEANRLHAAPPDELILAVAWSPASDELAVAKELTPDSGPATERWIDILSLDGAHSRRFASDPQIGPDQNAYTGLVYLEAERLGYTVAYKGADARTALLAAPLAGSTPAEIYFWPAATGIKVLARHPLLGLLYESQTIADQIQVGAFGASGLAAVTAIGTRSESWSSPRWLDAAALAFVSNRSGAWELWRIGLGDTKLTLLGAPGLEVGNPHPAGKGGLVYARRAPREANRWELAVAERGGEETRVAATDDEPFDVQCTARCVRCRASPTGLRFLAFDLTTGKDGAVLHERAVASPLSEWALAPDGLHVAVVDRKTPGLFVIDLGDGVTREVRWSAPAYTPQYLSWEPDGGGLVLAGYDRGRDTAVLFESRLDGKTRELLARRSDWYAEPAVAPDGAHLAFTTRSFDRQVWTLALP